jgi:hypothetical protein
MNLTQPLLRCVHLTTSPRLAPIAPHGIAAAALAALALLFIHTTALAGEFAQGLFWRID